MNDDQFERLIRDLHETPEPSQQLRRLPGAMLRAPGSPLRRLAAIAAGCVLIGLFFVLISLVVDGASPPAATGSSAADGAAPLSSSAATDAPSSSWPSDATPPATVANDGGESDPAAANEAYTEATRQAIADDEATHQAESEADAEATRQAETEADFEATMQAIQIEADFQATMQAIAAEERAWEATRTAQDLNTYCNPYMEDNTCD